VCYATDSYETATIALTRLQVAVIDVNSQEGRAYELSFSAGVAMFDPEEPLTLDPAHRARRPTDVRLQARQTGRS
jgi:hypothetical protein